MSSKSVDASAQVVDTYKVSLESNTRDTPDEPNGDPPELKTTYMPEMRGVRNPRTMQTIVVSHQMSPMWRMEKSTDHGSPDICRTPTNPQGFRAPRSATYSDCSPRRASGILPPTKLYASAPYRLRGICRWRQKAMSTRSASLKFGTYGVLAHCYAFADKSRVKDESGPGRGRMWTIRLCSAGRSHLANRLKAKG